MQVNKGSPNLDDLDLNPLFVQADSGINKRYCEELKINEVPDTLDQEIWPEIEKSLNKSEKIDKEFIIENTNRAVGTRISHHLYNKYGYGKAMHIEHNSKKITLGRGLGASWGDLEASGEGFGAS